MYGFVMIKKLLFSITLGMTLPSLGVNAFEQRPPNIVFFLVDDLGYMDVGCNNPKTFYETPNINRLAATGMRFTQGYAANPVCSPTRYSIMTDLSSRPSERRHGPRRNNARRSV